MWSIIGVDGTTITLEDVHVRLRLAQGAGMPPFQFRGESPATAVGTIGMRQLVLHLSPHLRHASLPDLRRRLLAALNPDLGDAATTAWLRFSNGSSTLELPIQYAGGLEDIAAAGTGTGARGSNDNGTLELRLFTSAACWQSTGDTSSSLPVQTSLGTLRYVVQRSADGIWSGFSLLDGPVSALLMASDGSIYVGGQFSGGVARWNSNTSSWDVLSGLTGLVFALLEGADGTLYAAGDMSNPASHVVAWNGTAWSVVGSLASVLPQAMALGHDGTLYVGGYDPLYGPAATVVAWDGSSWSDLGSGPGTRVNALLVDSQGSLYAGGQFPGGVKRWNGSSWTTLGGGIDLVASGTLDVLVLTQAPDGSIYAGGTFDRADGALANNIARWTGVAWQALGLGTGNTTYAIQVRPTDGMLLAGGLFTTAGGRSLPDNMARWNGYSWFPLDINLISAFNPYVTAMVAPADGSLLMVISGQATARAAAVTTVSNTGSAAAYPVVTINGPGWLTQLANWTSGDVLYLDVDLLAGETLTIDLRPGTRSLTSSFRGNLLGSIVPGSTLATWRLLPGDNRVSLFVDDETATASATIAWYTRYWSLDDVL